MWTIFKKSLKDKLKLTIIYSIVGIAMLALYAAVQPAMSSQMDQMNDYLKIFPKEFMAVFNVQDLKNFGSLEGMLSTEQFGLLWPILTAIFITNIAASTIAGEVDKKTLSLLLSQPISRAKIFWAKYLAGATLVIAYVLLSVTSIIPIAGIFEAKGNLDNTMIFTVEATFFTIFFYSLAYSISAFVSSNGPVNFMTLGIFFGMYFLTVLTKLQSSLEGIKYFSAFYYFDASRSFVDGKTLPEGFLLFGIFSIIFVVIGFLKFKKRDI